MTLTHAIALFSWACLGAMCARGQTEVPEWPARQELSVEVCQETLELPKGQFDRYTMRPDYVAAFVRLDDSGPVRLADGRHYYVALLDADAAKAFSVDQRKLIEIVGVTTWPLIHLGSSFSTLAQRLLADAEQSPKDEGPKATLCLMWAMTEQDARLMAQAEVEAVDTLRRSMFELDRQRIVERRRVLAEAKRQFPKVESELARCAGELEHAQTNAKYDNADEARQDVRELDRSVRTIDIEMTGIRAKTEAISRHRSAEGARDPGTALLLDRLLMEEDINLAGALARRAAVETHRKNAQAFYDASTAHSTAADQLAQLQKRIATGEEQEKQDEAWCSDPPAYARPMVVVNNKVIIQKLK
jgi:hypothetical protein